MPTTMTCNRPATTGDPYAESDWQLVEEEPPYLTDEELTAYMQQNPVPQEWYDDEDSPF